MEEVHADGGRKGDSGAADLDGQSVDDDRVTITRTGGRQNLLVVTRKRRGRPKKGISPDGLVPCAASHPKCHLQISTFVGGDILAGLNILKFHRIGVYRERVNQNAVGQTIYEIINNKNIKVIMWASQLNFNN